MSSKQGMSVNTNSSGSAGVDFLDFDINFDSSINEELQGSTLLELLTGANLLEISRDIKRGWSEVKEQVSSLLGLEIALLNCCRVGNCLSPSNQHCHSL
jgi:hypothetical protein